MPWIEHYRLTKPFPERLQYPSATVVLEIVDVPGADSWADGCVFQARKLSRGGQICALHSARTFRELKTELYHAGFPAARGLDHPQVKIMERLCREGFAEKTILKINGKTGLRS